MLEPARDAFRGWGVATTVLEARWSIPLMVVLLSFGFVTPAWHGPALSSPPGPAPAVYAGPPPCTVPLPSSGVHGQLTIDGGPLAGGSDGGWALNYTYTVAYREVYASNLTAIGAGCLTEHGNTTTSGNGSFSFTPISPQDNCTTTDLGQVCWEFSEPYAPANLSVAGGAPLGYAVSVAGWYASVAVAFVYELASVTITPGGPTVTTSVGYPTGFSAAAWEANGTSSPVRPTFVWSLGGTGWSFQGPATGPSVQLSAVDGASVATLTVSANASVPGGRLPAVAATVDVVAVPTEIETGQMNRTTVDAGGTVAVRLAGFGASGFPYSASVDPGLGLAEVAAPCSEGAPTDGTVELACQANITYPSAGTAQPTANLTNGYSAASWRFPDVVVSPLPELEVTPAAPVGYALTPVPITVTAANGSGASPFASACLEVGSAGPTCSTSPGPAWPFGPTFPTPGTYPARAWVVDADGANVSITFPVEVVPPLLVGPLASLGANATVGAPVELNSTVGGGVLPLHYWWNSSAGPDPLLQGELASDGPLDLTMVPAAPGPVVVTLTVVDRLGNVVARDLVVDVGPPTAERIAAVSATLAGPVTVGTPVSLAWAAFELSGAADGTFETAAELTVEGGDGAPEAWANASGVGALPPLGNGAYGVPASAWVEGRLAVTLTLGTAGEVSVSLSGTGVPGGVGPTNLSVEPDYAHLRLYAPTVVRAGGRTNATFWRVEDRFGNPVPGAQLTVDLSFGGSQSEAVVAAVPVPGGGSGVWVNYSAPAPGEGEVSVVDAAGAVVLGPLAVPAAASPSTPDPTVDTLAAVVPLGAAGVATLAVVRRRRARRAGPAEEELRQLAEGRARTVEMLESSGAIDLAGLEAAWDPTPAPPALADWLASLVADGTVRATVGEDGRARFCLAQRPAEAPRVTVDPLVLDESLRHRDEELRPDPRSEDGSEG